MTHPKRNFLGIPVQGDITPGATRVEQKPIEELQPMLQAVLADPTIVEFGWQQYTPYFNDGEPCIFRVCGLWARTTTDADVEDRVALDVEYSHPSLGVMTGGEWIDDPDRPGFRKKVGQRYEGPDQARYERCHALDGALQGGAFEHVLLDAFGDHAEITVRRDGIEIEFYDHD